MKLFIRKDTIRPNVGLNSVRITETGAHTVLDLILALLPYVIAFAAGYGIREFISRRRRAAARKEYLQKQEEEEAKRYNQLERGDGPTLK